MGRKKEVPHCHDHQELEKRVRDTTEELRAANLALDVERRRLYNLLEEIPAILCVLAPDYTYRFINHRFRRVFGDAREHPCFHVKAGRDAPCQDCRVAKAFEERVPVEWEWTSPAGNVYQLYHYPFTESDGSPAVLELGIDITEGRRAAEILRHSERKLHYLSAQLLQIQESERARISRELHDELGQGLSTLKLRLAVIRKQLRKDQDALKSECDETLALVDQIIDEIRRLARNLSPRTLEDLGLVAALRRLVGDFAKRSMLEVSSQIDDIDQLLSKDAEIILYRIVQEALTNIRKHAEAERASLLIERLDDSVRCLVEDDGRGFDLDTDHGLGSSENGMGIAIMKERIRILGGSLDFWSQPGRGTRISFLIPAGHERAES